MAIFWLILSIFWNNENTYSNLSETFNILFFHEKNRIEEKKACFGDFSIFGKIAVSGPYRRGHFFVDFEYFLKCWKYLSNFSEKFKILFFHENNFFEEKKGMFCVLFNLDQYRCIRTLPAWPFFGSFWVCFEIKKIPFQFCWNIQNLVLSWKQSVWRKKSRFWGLLKFSAKSLYPDLTGVAIFWLILNIFWNMLKILFQFFRNIQHFVLSWKESDWRKKSMFTGLFNFWQNRCIRTLPAWPFFGWFWVFFEIMKIRFQFYVKH